MSILGNWGKTLGDAIANLTAKKIAAAIGAALVSTGTAAWIWLYDRVNPEFIYETAPSSAASHFVGLGNVLKSIEKDSRLYCSGGWDQRVARIGLHVCYEFTFDPPLAYSTYVCTHDQTGERISTSDQLAALRRFEKRYPNCLVVGGGSSGTSFVIRPGAGSSERMVQFGSTPPEKSFFCGCSAQEEQEIAAIIGGTIR